MKVNSVNLIGYIVKDPELKYTPNGNAVVSFTVAVDTGKKGDDGKRESDFFDVVVFGRPKEGDKLNQAEFIASNYQKGTRVGVSGSLKQDRWVDNNGNKKSRVRIIATRVDGLANWREDSNKQDTATETASEDEPDFG